MSRSKVFVARLLRLLYAPYLLQHGNFCDVPRKPVVLQFPAPGSLGPGSEPEKWGCFWMTGQCLSWNEIDSNNEIGDR